MDVGSFVQENKRWLLGCGIGGVVYLIASAVIGSLYDVRPQSASKLGAPTEAYNQAALTAARSENEQLVAERTRLQQELAFKPTAKFELASNGRPDEYLFKMGRDLKQTIVGEGGKRDVQVTDANVIWDVPSTYDDQRATLFGLELIDEMQKRLYAAHDQTRAASEEAIGLRAIVSMKLDARRNRSQPRSARPGEVVVSDFLTQEQVSFQFLADEPTLLAFFESCRQRDRTLVIDSWQVLKPARPGEPCAVKGTLQGIVWKVAEAPAPVSVSSAGGKK